MKPVSYSQYMRSVGRTISRRMKSWNADGVEDVRLHRLRLVDEDDQVLGVNALEGERPPRR